MSKKMAAAKETSVDAAVVAVLSEKQRKALKPFVFSVKKRHIGLTLARRGSPQDSVTPQVSSLAPIGSQKLFPTSQLAVNNQIYPLWMW